MYGILTDHRDCGKGWVTGI